MTETIAPISTQRQPIGRGTALARGLLGWLVLWLGLGIAICVMRVLTNVGLSEAAQALGQAALMTVLVVPPILALRARLDRRSAAGLGWARPALGPILLGLGVGFGTGVLAWAPAFLFGWVRLEALDLSAFVSFLVLNGLALLFYEGLPEELALRGYLWTNLRDGFGTAVATLLTTILSPLGGILVTGLAAGITALSSTETSPVSFFLADPVVYLIQLTLFGLALIAARRVPLPGALFAAVAFHGAQLTVTRTMLGGLGSTQPGWDLAFVQPDATALVLLHIVPGSLAFVIFRRRHSAKRLSADNSAVRPSAGTPLR